MYIPGIGATHTAVSNVANFYIRTRHCTGAGAIPAGGGGGGNRKKNPKSLMDGRQMYKQVTTTGPATYACCQQS